MEMYLHYYEERKGRCIDALGGKDQKCTGS